MVRGAEYKGTIGCFLSHVRAWEEVARLSEQYAVVLEDDVDIVALSQLPPFAIPVDADIIFLNDRMAASNHKIDALRVLPVWCGLEHLDALRSGPGGDGYLLTPNGAKLLLTACLKDFYYGHVDGRLLRYSTSEADLAVLSNDSWIAKVVRNHHHPRLVPTLGLLRGYCLSSPLVVHRGTVSTREAEDVAARDLTIQPTTQGSPLPMRYWNRTRNIGDLINPYIVEAVSGRRPYFCVSETTEHLLGIGSILFMATQNSHIWGSGILDPTRDHSQVVVSKVHAVRGKLTQKILRDRHGLSRDVALGDPAVFADELPELAQYRLDVLIKRKIGLVPHFAMEKSDYIAYLARELDADILSPRTDNLSFVREIMASEIIISQSLHGLIFTEVFSKPSVWLAHTSDEIWTFKFHDWFSNVAEPPLAPMLFGTPPGEVLSTARLSGLSIDKTALR
jgi:glycosyl transferase family 25/polysaccharide pyruvyl transferase